MPTSRNLNLYIQEMKKIFAVNESASKNLSNQQLIDIIADMTKEIFMLTVFNDLKKLPHFDPELSIKDTPKVIIDFRQEIEKADAILICTPEYVFSLPSGLKNAIEQCVSTTIFSEKPTGIIAASASGEKGHEELQLILKTIMALFTADTTLLIQGIKGKINKQNGSIDKNTKDNLEKFIDAFERLIRNGSN